LKYVLLDRALYINGVLGPVYTIYERRSSNIDNLVVQPDDLWLADFRYREHAKEFKRNIELRMEGR
jgi:hypothetical protein